MDVNEWPALEQDDRESLGKDKETTRPVTTTIGKEKSVEDHEQGRKKDTDRTDQREEQRKHNREYNATGKNPPSECPQKRQPSDQNDDWSRVAGKGLKTYTTTSNEAPQPRYQNRYQGARNKEARGGGGQQHQGLQFPNTVDIWQRRNAERMTLQLRDSMNEYFDEELEKGGGHISGLSHESESRGRWNSRGRTGANRSKRRNHSNRRGRGNNHNQANQQTNTDYPPHNVESQQRNNPIFKGLNSQANDNDDSWWRPFKSTESGEGTNQGRKDYSLDYMSKIDNLDDTSYY